MADTDILSDAELETLRGFDTPTICNALEIVAPERRLYGYTTEPLVCPYPELKPICGYARTGTIRATEPSAAAAADQRKKRLSWYEYVAKGGPLPSVIVLHDLDGARAGYGSFWGEVNSHIHRGLGAAGVVTDGSIRDIDMNAKGFQMLARCIMPSHAWIHNVDIGIEVSICGMAVKSGDLVHADRHGAVVIPHAVARKIAGACDLLARREAVLIEAAKKPGFTFEILAKAIADSAEIH
jgi:regulator of RNase E activity RraA